MEPNESCMPTRWRPSFPVFLAARQSANDSLDLHPGWTRWLTGDKEAKGSCSLVVSCKRWGLLVPLHALHAMVPL